MPGPDDGRIKSTPRLVATEGVVASLFSRWVTDPILQRSVAASGFYARFGVAAGDVAPIEHAYLKIFSVLADRRPHDTAALLRDYVVTFPDEADAVAAVARRTGLAWPLPEVPEIWLANDQFLTGTTLFDQYRALPRVHTFDLNAASLVDLAGVGGMSVELAGAIQQGAPYASLADLARVPVMTRAIAERFREMQSGMIAIREANAGDDIEAIDLMRLFRPVVLRAVVWILLAAAAAAWLYGRVRALRVWRLAVNGFAGSAASLVPAWILGAALQYGERPVEPALIAVAPIAALGLMAALWHVVRHRRARDAARVFAAWLVTAIPPLLVITPLA
jgi:hypothetical protein